MEGSPAGHRPWLLPAPGQVAGGPNGAKLQQQPERHPAVHESELVEDHEDGGVLDQVRPPLDLLGGQLPSEGALVAWLEAALSGLC